MKKILSIILFAFVVLSFMTFATFAEDSTLGFASNNEPVTESSAVSEENAAESELSGIVTSPSEETQPTIIAPPPEEILTTSDKVVEWIQANLEEISVIITLLFTIVYQVRKHAKLNKSMGILNNNAIVVAESSNKAINSALDEVKSVGMVVGSYQSDFTALLSEIRKSAEEKQLLEITLSEVNEYLKKAKEANIEFSNELAELLVLANIPNSKKEELYARHRAAVNAISNAEAEVNKNDGKEA